jgi:hypothetical protein
LKMITLETIVISDGSSLDTDNEASLAQQTLLCMSL